MSSVVGATAGYGTCHHMLNTGVGLTAASTVVGAFFGSSLFFNDYINIHKAVFVITTLIIQGFSFNHSDLVFSSPIAKFINNNIVIIINVANNIGLIGSLIIVCTIFRQVFDKQYQTHFLFEYHIKAIVYQYL